VRHEVRAADLELLEVDIGDAPPFHAASHSPRPGPNMLRPMMNADAEVSA
jgi:hypothetical protein